MAITPEDVVNKRFQPTKFREGYDQDEVDDFLDEVVLELRRLIKENNELRRNTSSQKQEVHKKQHLVSRAQPVTAPRTKEKEQSSQVVKTSQAYSGEVEDSAASVIMMAQKIHDQHVREGLHKREEMIAKAENDVRHLVSDAQQRHDEVVEGLQKEKAVLETKVEQLRIFDRDYRARLKAYIESHLRELDVSGSMVQEINASAASKNSPMSAQIPYFKPQEAAKPLEASPEKMGPAPTGAFPKFTAKNFEPVPKFIPPKKDSV